MNTKQARYLHRMLDRLVEGERVEPHEVEELRKSLPEPPAQMTLEELRREVYDAWAGTEGNEWPDDVHGNLEMWLNELRDQLKGLANAHPEFLETEDDYENAPEGTIVACDDSLPWHKFNSGWLSAVVADKEDVRVLSRVRRRVLRWGNK